jgi:predicted branched-subunit amino acid permease
VAAQARLREIYLEECARPPSEAAMVRVRGHLVPVAVGAAAALAVTPLAGSGWGIVAAGLCGAAVAALTARPGVLR